MQIERKYPFDVTANVKKEKVYFHISFGSHFKTIYVYGMLVDVKIVLYESH